MLLVTSAGGRRGHRSPDQCSPAGASPSASVPSGVAVVSTPDGGGYWVASSTGAVYPFGDARSFGSMAGTPLNAPIVGMAPTPDGEGYWLVATDGGSSVSAMPV